MFQSGTFEHGLMFLKCLLDRANKGESYYIRATTSFSNSLYISHHLINAPNAKPYHDEESKQA